MRDGEDELVTRLQGGGGHFLQVFSDCKLGIYFTVVSLLLKSRESFRSKGSSFTPGLRNA